MFYTVSAVLLATAVAFASGAADVNCQVGTQWVENYIKFECYSSATIVKGIRPIGCVPTNTNNGAMIAPGTTHDETHFRYKCSTGTGDSLSYAITNCFDSATPPKIMSPGENRVMADGSTVSCYKDGDQIKKKVEKATGCKATDGKTYTSGQTWIVTLPTATTYQKGVAMRCTNAGASGFVSSSYGCVTTTGNVIQENKYGTVSNQVVKCSKNANGDCELVKVADEEVQCTSEGSVYKNGVEWDNKAKDARFRCNYGVLVKIGCYYNSGTGAPTLVGLYVTQYFDSTPFYCMADKGYIFSTNVTGCTLADKTAKKFWEQWTTDTGVFQCKFQFVNGVAQAYVEQIRCIYATKTFNNNQIILIDDVPMKCARSDGYNLAVRKLTDAEFTAWQNSQQGSTNGEEFGGVGGSGSGASMTTESTTTTTTTTTEAPTTTTTTEEPTTTTTTTEAPTTTTTTEAPTTTTTTEEPTTTTTTEAPTTTTTTEEPTTTIIIEEPTTTTTTEAPTTTATTEEPTTTTTTEAPTTTTTTEEPTTTIIIEEPTTTTTTEAPTTTATITEEPTTTTTTEEPTTTQTQTTTIQTITTPAVTADDDCKDTLAVCGELAAVCAGEIVEGALDQMTALMDKLTFPVLKESIDEMLPKIEKSLPLLKQSLPLLKENGIEVPDLPELEQSLPLLQQSLPLLKQSLPLLKQSLPLLKEMVKEMENPSSSEAEESGCKKHRSLCEASGDSGSAECEEHRKSGCGECSDCHKKTRKPCKRCAVFKRKAKEFVQAVCPKTCNACKKDVNMDSIIKVFVKFYSTN